MKKPTKKQRIAWLEAGCCHICGKNVPHGHPNWMWLANPPPKITEEVSEEVKERVRIENEMNKATLANIVGRELK